MTICKTKNCKRTATFNFEGEPKPAYCGEHRKIDMKDVKNKKCTEVGCEKAPNYNNKGETKGLYCNDHKKADMINVRSKTCKEKNCDKFVLFILKKSRQFFIILDSLPKSL